MGALREKMDQELWKGVLKSEAALVEKERALNEVQAKREQLWGQRESLVSSMQAEMSAEQARMAKAWASTLGGWEKMQADHEVTRAPPSCVPPSPSPSPPAILSCVRRCPTRCCVRRCLATGGGRGRGQTARRGEPRHQADRRGGDDRQGSVSAMSAPRDGAAAAQGGGEQAPRVALRAMDSVAKQREEVYKVAEEGAKLEAVKLAAEAESRNADERLVDKERQALSEHQSALQARRQRQSASVSRSAPRRPSPSRARR